MLNNLFVFFHQFSANPTEIPPWYWSSQRWVSCLFFLCFHILIHNVKTLWNSLHPPEIQAPPAVVCRSRSWRRTLTAGRSDSEKKTTNWRPTETDLHCFPFFFLPFSVFVYLAEDSSFVVFNFVAFFFFLP